MKITLIVADNMVYIGNRTASVDLSALADSYRAVQWQERTEGVGHVEMFDGENIPLDAEGFAELSAYVESAEAIFAAEDEAARQQQESQAALDVLAAQVAQQ